MGVLGEPQNSKGAVLGLILAGIVGFGLLRSCSDATPAASTNLSEAPATLLENVEAPSAPVPPAPNEALVRRAARHLRLALDAEGFSGAMIYSQNCFASLDRQFSWSKLDQCGAFDSLAQLAIDQDQSLGPEQRYFEKNALGGRLTAAAGKSGSTAETAQEHFSTLAEIALERIPDLQQPAVQTSSNAEALAADDPVLGGPALDGDTAGLENPANTGDSNDE